MVIMMKINVSGGYIDLDLNGGLIASVNYNGVQICAKQAPLFVVRLTENGGKVVDFSATSKKS